MNPNGSFGGDTWPASNDRSTAHAPRPLPGGLPPISNPSGPGNQRRAQGVAPQSMQQQAGLGNAFGSTGSSQMPFNQYEETNSWFGSFWNWMFSSPDNGQETALAGASASGQRRDMNAATPNVQGAGAKVQGFAASTASSALLGSNQPYLNSSAGHPAFDASINQRQQQLQSLNLNINSPPDPVGPPHSLARTQAQANQFGVSTTQQQHQQRATGLPTQVAPAVNGPQHSLLQGGQNPLGDPQQPLQPSSSQNSGRAGPTPQGQRPLQQLDLGGMPSSALGFGGFAPNSSANAGQTNSLLGGNPLQNTAFPQPLGMPQSPLNPSQTQAGQFQNNGGPQSNLLGNAGQSSSAQRSGGASSNNLSSNPLASTNASQTNNLLGGNPLQNTAFPQPLGMPQSPLNPLQIQAGQFQNNGAPQSNLLSAAGQSNSAQRSGGASSNNLPSNPFGMNASPTPSAGSALSQGSMLAQPQPPNLLSNAGQSNSSQRSGGASSNNLPSNPFGMNAFPIPSAGSVLSQGSMLTQPQPPASNLPNHMGQNSARQGVPAQNNAFSQPSRMPQSPSDAMQTTAARSTTSPSAAIPQVPMPSGFTDPFGSVSAGGPPSLSMYSQGGPSSLGHRQSQVSPFSEVPPGPSPLGSSSRGSLQEQLLQSLPSSQGNRNSASEQSVLGNQGSRNGSGFGQQSPNNPSSLSASGQQRHSMAPTSVGGPQVNLQAGGFQTSPIAVSPDPAIQNFISQQLQNSPLQRYNIPPYPAPPDIAPVSPAGGPAVFKARLDEISQRVYAWTQIFAGNAVKMLTQDDQRVIRGCLDVFRPIEQGLVAALDADQLSIEGLYFTPSHRRILAEHIIAMNILVLVFYPFYVGLDREVGKILVGITDRLYRDPRTCKLDYEWRRAVCRHLSAQVNAQTSLTEPLVRLSPVLQALYPRPDSIDWTPLVMILKDLVELFRDIKVDKDIYAPIFLNKGAQRTQCYEIVRNNQGSGPVFLCTFPGLTRRYWDEQRQMWIEALLTPAIVELESALVMS